MRPIDTESSLGDLVTAHPATAPVMERFGLDYCCGGSRSLAEACSAADLDVDEVATALSSPGRDDVPHDWSGMGPAQLADHLEATHHSYLRDELPRLSALAEKVATVHGENHRELAAVRDTFESLRADLEPHLLKEEQILFPIIRELAAAENLPQFHCGSVANPIRAMGVEHDAAGELLGRLNELTGGFDVPEDGCASYRALYDGLAELETDLHLHIHKENNVLFPAAIDLERRLTEV